MPASPYLDVSTSAHRRNYAFVAFDRACALYWTIADECDMSSSADHSQSWPPSRNAVSDRSDCSFVPRQTIVLLPNEGDTGPRSAPRMLVTIQVTPALHRRCRKLIARLLITITATGVTVIPTLVNRSRGHGYFHFRIRARLPLALNLLLLLSGFTLDQSCSGSKDENCPSDPFHDRAPHSSPRPSSSSSEQVCP